MAFVDNIVIIAESENDLQTILKRTENWCKKWKLKVNTEKRNVVHFCKRRSSKTEFVFDNTVLNIVDIYKNLGTILNEHSNI